MPRFLTYARVRAIVPYTRQHLGRLERAGRFPRRVALGPGRVAWAEDEIRAWMESRKADRGGEDR
jgi:prophage regulatory protein